MNTYYKQCIVQYESTTKSTVWIPEQFAKKSKNIIVGKSTLKGIKAKVIRVFENTKLTQEQIDLNRKSKFDSIMENSYK